MSTVDKQVDLSPNSGERFETITLPGELVERVQRRLKNSDFATVDEYIGYVVDQVLSQVEGADSGDVKAKGDEVFSKEDQENVEQRLRDLGYM